MTSTDTGRHVAVDLVKRRAKSPLVIGAAIGAATAAGLATRKSPPGLHKDGGEPDRDQTPNESSDNEPPEQQRRSEPDGAPKAGMREQLLGGFLQRIAADKYFDVALMDRVERLIDTRDELEQYLEMLVERVGSEKFVTGDTLNRVERLLVALRRLQRAERARA